MGNEKIKCHTIIKVFVDNGSISLKIELELAVGFSAYDFVIELDGKFIIHIKLCNACYCLNVVVFLKIILC
jgi:hypothetical protein